MGDSLSEVKQKKSAENKTDNRQVIKEKALHLFYRKGYDAVGVQEIVQTAGITKPTLYYYFKCKQGLLQAILDEKCRKLNGDLWKAANFNGNLVGTLECITNVYMNIAVEDQEFFIFMNSLYFTAKDNEAYQVIRPYIVEQFCIVRSVFEQAAYQLGNMHNRQEQFAIGFIGMITHFIMFQLERGDEPKQLLDRHTIYSLVHQFMHGINS